MRNVIYAICAVMAMAALSAAQLNAIEPADVNDPGVVAAANFVLVSANKNNCNGLCVGLRIDCKLKLVQITSATSQVVSGTNYRLQMLMADRKGNQARHYFNWLLGTASRVPLCES